MKRLNLGLFFMGVIFLLNGCDLPSQIAQSNALQGQILDGVQKTANLTDALQKLSGSGYHLQVLGAALLGLLSPENTAQLFPPTRMIPYAQSFAGEATDVDLIQFADLMRQDIETKGQSPLLLPNSSNTVQSRITSLIALSCVGGFVALDKMKTLMSKQVEKHGPNEEAAYFFAEARYIFLRDGLLTPAITTATVYNIETLKLAAYYYAGIKHLAQLPYVAKILINVPDIQVTPPNGYQLNVTEAKSLGVQAKQAFQDKLDPTLVTTAQVQTLLAGFNW